MTFARAPFVAPLCALLLAACGGGHAQPGQGGGGATGSSTGSSTGTVGGAGGETGGAGGCQAVDISHAGETAASPALVHLVDTAAHPEALCNDGTPAAYVFRPGSGAAKNRWLIYLEGGGECATAEDCQARYQAQPGLMSSQGAVEGAVFSTALDGIKSTDAAVNPDFRDATLVQIAYCSSDGWTGDRAGNAALPTSDGGHWHFRGRAIVQAVLAEIASRGLGEATEVLLLGSSAGGVGVFNNADDVRATLPAGVRFAALADAGFLLDYPAYDPATGLESTVTPSPRMAELIAGAALWGGRGDLSCEQAATDDAARLLCRSPANLVVHGHVQAPLLIRQSQLDAVQLKQLVAPSDKSAEAKAFRGRFAAKMREALGQVGPAFAVFSPLDSQHGVINDAAWSTQIVNGTSLVSAVSAYYRDPCSGGAKLIESP